MKYLIIAGHPNPDSFCSSLTKELYDHLLSEGNEAELRDLYALGFDPVLSAADFSAIAANRMPADIKTEQEYILWADHLIFVYPLWCGGLPAVLKGYIDRVFAEGFAYRYTDKGGEGLLAPRKGSTVCSTGEAYEEGGEMHRAMNLIFKSTVFGYSGMEPCKSLYCGEVPTVSREVRASYIERVKKEFTGKQIV